MFSKLPQSNNPVSTTAPPKTLPCPAIYFVRELTVNDAKTELASKTLAGVIVLSTINKHFLDLHNCPIARKSAT